MVRNTKGGNKHKKQANSIHMERPLELPDEEQYFALVGKPLGNGQFAVKYIEGTEKESQYSCDSIGIICGKLRRRKQWVIEGNFVLITKRNFENNKQRSKVDIIHVYKEYEINELKRKKLINEKLIKISNGASAKFGSKDDDEEFTEFCLEEDNINTKNTFNKNNKKEQYVDFSYLDNSSDEEENE
tara:strand:- start:768 stop:1325 length:558 start_codon:yes stop_codon:yes gene_type:complete